MREITVKLYKLDELPTEKAKEKARQWYREAVGYDQWWDYVYEDAEQVGLKITEFEIDRGRYAKGKFIDDALHCAGLIIKNHGEKCETYTTAKAFLKERDEIVNAAEKDENGDYVDEHELYGKLDECEAEFLRAILEDYAVMLDKEYEYLNSDEHVDEDILGNEYEFTENGKRA